MVRINQNFLERTSTLFSDEYNTLRSFEPRRWILRRNLLNRPLEGRRRLRMSTVLHVYLEIKESKRSAPIPALSLCNRDRASHGLGKLFAGTLQLCSREYNGMAIAGQPHCIA